MPTDPVLSRDLTDPKLKPLVERTFAVIDYLKRRKRAKTEQWLERQYPDDGPGREQLEGYLTRYEYLVRALYLPPLPDNWRDG